MLIVSIAESGQAPRTLTFQRDIKLAAIRFPDGIKFWLYELRKPGDYPKTSSWMNWVEPGANLRIENVVSV